MSELKCTNKFTKDEDSDYFKCYSDMSIHLEMLNDEVRTNTYRYAILKNYELFYKKVVLDVGAGTGVLSMFCVQAGAKKVYSVEASDMAFEAKKVISDNGMDSRICVMHGKIEDVELPEKVDVIVSEWMGYCLFYESMLKSVLYARDKYLRKGGAMFPHTAVLYMLPISDDDVILDGSDVWEKSKNLYKINMTSLKSRAINNFTGKIHINQVNPQTIVSLPSVISKLDLSEVSLSSLSKSYCESEFTFNSFGTVLLNGFCTYFDVIFLKDIILSTSPYNQPTHWNQSVMYLKEPVQLYQDDVIRGHIFISPNYQDERGLDVTVEYDVEVNPNENFPTNFEPATRSCVASMDGNVDKMNNNNVVVLTNINVAIKQENVAMNNNINNNNVETFENSSQFASTTNSYKYTQHFTLNKFC